MGSLNTPDVKGSTHFRERNFDSLATWDDLCVSLEIQREEEGMGVSRYFLYLLYLEGFSGAKWN